MFEESLACPFSVAEKRKLSVPAKKIRHIFLMRQNRLLYSTKDFFYMKTRVLLKTLAALLSCIMLATGSYVPVMAENAVAASEQAEEAQRIKRKDSQEQETILVASFDDTFEEKMYPLDQAPAEEELIQTFPSELSVTTADGDSITVPVLSWESSDYNPNVPGDYTFTPVLAEGYDDSLAPSIPWIEVSIVKNEVTDIQTVLENRSYLLSEAPAKDEIENALPKTLTASVNGEDEDISILSWDTDYDMSRVGTYTFLPVIDDTRYSYESTELPLVSDPSEHPQRKALFFLLHRKARFLPSDPYLLPYHLEQ